MWRGMEFHILGAAIWKAWAPNERLFRGTESFTLTKTTVFGLLGEYHMILGLFLLKWYHDMTDGQTGGTAAAAPPTFRPSEPALCGSCPLVTPYYCSWLGDLLCFVFIVRLLCFSVIDVLYVSLQYFDTVGWVFWPVKTVSHISYTVLEGT